MSDEETKRWTIDIPTDLHERANRVFGHGERSEAIRDFVEVVVTDGWSVRTPFDVEIRNLKDQRREFIDEKRRLEDKIGEIDDDIERLQNQREEHDDIENKLEGVLTTLDSNLRRRGMNIHKDNPIIKDAAQSHGVSREEIIERVRDRNPDVPAHAFEPHGASVTQWTGFTDESVATLPPGDRRE